MMYLSLAIGLSIVLEVVMGFRVVRALRRFSIKKQYSAAIEAPSVSVCIAARNETHAMTRSLERILASDYKKLEVIVYDDSSTDNTSALIRSFAHEGVRFVAGTALAEGWLGRNHAFEVLAQEASGTYVLFIDVDTFIEPTTISRLVGYMTAENLVMASVLPGRQDTWRASALFGHLRYFWEIILDRRGALAISSSLWMIKRHVLVDTLGGFSSHKAEVSPESHIATLIGTVGYHCLINSPDLGVTYEKKWLSQVETSRRTLYPMMGGMWYGGIAGVALLSILNIPTLVVVGGLFYGWDIPQFIAIIGMSIGIITYWIYLRRMWQSRSWLGAIVWPYALVQELFLFISSAIGYARQTITWKGRSIVASPVRVDHIEIDE